MNVGQILDFAAERFPDKEAVVTADSKLTYRQLAISSNKVASFLVEEGVKKGDKVALISFNVPEMLVSFFGIVKAGGVAVPINYKSRAPEIKYLVDHSDSVFVIYGQSLTDTVLKAIHDLKKVRGGIYIGSQGAGEHISYPEIMSNYDLTAPGVDIEMLDAAEIIYTSGTTGDPKGCVLNHNNLFLVAMMAAGTFGLNVKSRTLHAMPLYHSAPLNLMMLGTTLVAGTHVLLPEYNPQKFLEVIQKEKITHLFAAPIALLAPMQLSNFSSYDLSSVVLWIYGGGPISSANAEILMKKYKTDRFMQVYGLSESGPNGSYLAPEDQLSKAGSIGFCGTMNAHLRVINNSGDDIKSGEIGEIIIRSETNMTEYYKNPSATAETLKDGWVYTGDLARMDIDGYYYIVDRKKDMIVTGGENVYTKEVEDAIAQLQGVGQVAVFGVPHEDWGETVAAAIVLKPGTKLSPEDVQLFLHERLAKFKIPRIIKFYESLPITPTGKVMKYQLREEFKIHRENNYDTGNLH
ncbi:MAG: class I adenylate-forming enzyme family protein [Candidatus Kryptoniota bacterium]